MEIAFHGFSSLNGSYSVFHNVSSPSNLIIAYSVLFAIPKPANKPNCGYFTTHEKKTYQVGTGCVLPGNVDARTPLELPELNEQIPHHFCVGHRHAALIVGNGSIYSWGTNDHGQLGHGDEADVRPKKVDSDIPFSKVYCAANATIAITRSGDIYQWGLLNPQSSEQYNTPHKCGINAEQVYVGANHAGATKGNKLFMWGLGADGRLGLNSTKDVSCDKPERVRVSVEDVAVGTRSTAIIDEDFKVKVFGKNYGHLKANKGPAILTPTAIKKLEDAEVLAASWTDDFFLANLEDRSQWIFGDQVAVDDPDADKTGPGISKGSSPKKMKKQLEF